jgi:hypothetical protein
VIDVVLPTSNNCLIVNNQQEYVLSVTVKNFSHLFETAMIIIFFYLNVQSILLCLDWPIAGGALEALDNKYSLYANMPVLRWVNWLVFVGLLAGGNVDVWLLLWATEYGRPPGPSNMQIHHLMCILFCTLRQFVSYITSSAFVFLINEAFVNSHSHWTGWCCWELDWIFCCCSDDISRLQCLACSPSVALSTAGRRFLFLL